MNAKRWTLGQAEHYFARDAITRPKLRRHLALAACTVDFPGLAACYWGGGEEFRRLRRATETALGGRLDLRRYHDAVLSASIAPLSVLEVRLPRLSDTLKSNS